MYQNKRNIEIFFDEISLYSLQLSCLVII